MGEFSSAKRIDISKYSPDEVKEIIHQTVDIEKLPIVLTNFLENTNWKTDIFNLDWLKKHYGDTGRCK